MSPNDDDLRFPEDDGPTPSLDDLSDLPAELPEVSSSPQIDDLGLPPLKASKVPTGGAFKCPKCGREQPKGDACVKCGVIFARLKTNPKTPVPEAAKLPEGVKLVVGNPELAPPTGIPKPSSIPPRAPSGALPIPTRGASGSQRAASAPQKPGRPSLPPAGVIASVPPFWSSVGEAFTVPFIGKGILWIPIMIGVLFIGAVWRRAQIWSYFGVLGMMANYFAGALSIGSGGDTRAPDLPQQHAIKAEFIYPGIAIIVLALLLWGPAVYKGYSIASAIQDADNAQMEKKYAEAEKNYDELETREFDPEETFRSKEGRIIKLAEDDPDQLVELAGGRWAEVRPSAGYMLLFPKTWKPGDPRPDQGFRDIDAEEEKKEKSKADNLGPDWFRRASGGDKFWFVLLFLLPFFYWPAALAVSSLTGNIFQIFNPIEVIPSAIKGGVEYTVTACIALAVLAIPFLVALRTDPENLGWVFFAFLLGLGYCACVQGFLIGRLVAAKPGAFPEPKE